LLVFLWFRHLPPTKLQREANVGTGTLEQRLRAVALKRDLCCQKIKKFESIFAQRVWVLVMSGWCVMRGVNATKFVSNRLVGSALLVSALLLTATSVQAMGLGGKAAEPNAATQAAPGEAAMPDQPAMSGPAAGGVPKSMMAPSPFNKAATLGDSAPVAPPAVMPAKPAMASPAPAAMPAAPITAADGSAAVPVTTAKPTMTPPVAAPPAPVAMPAAPVIAAERSAPPAKPTMTPVLVPLAAGQQPSAAKSVAIEKPTEQPSDFSGRKADYYDNRAKEKLAEENKADGPGRLHPLQAALPSHSVIVCEAGCLKEGVYVVSKTLKATVRPAVAPLSANMPTAGVVGRDRTLDCRGGCDRPEVRMGIGAPRPAVAPQALNESAGRWLTSVTPQAPAAQVPTSKMPMLEAPAAKMPIVEAPTTAAPAAPQAKSSRASREDWLARINRERAAEKATETPDTSKQ
jgi:hypothetical protein